MKILFSLFSILFVLNVSSQEVQKTNAILLPTSIYTTSLNNLSSTNNSAPSENVGISVASIKKEISTIFTENLGRQSSKFFNETFQERVMNKAITSAFFDLDALYDFPREHPTNN